jgi:hypothetical protein
MTILAFRAPQSPLPEKLVAKKDEGAEEKPAPLRRSEL